MLSARRPWPTSVPPQLIFHQSKWSHGQLTVMTCGELERRKPPPHCQQRRKARGEQFAGQDIWFIRGWHLHFSAECSEKISRTALATVMHGSCVSDRIQFGEETESCFLTETGEAVALVNWPNERHESFLLTLGRATLAVSIVPDVHAKLTANWLLTVASYQAWE